MHTFIGAAGFLRNYIANLSVLLDPLQRLLLTEKVTGKQKHSSNVALPWEVVPDARSAFEIVKQAIAAAPTLNHFDPERLIAINIDASTCGIGSVLYQPRYEGEPVTADNVVTFRSHSLKKYERGYAGSAYKLELLAIVTALGDYHDFIWGREFVLKTDHKALTFMHTQSGLNRHLSTWLDILMQYDFKISHIAGVENTLADGLSRLYPVIWGIPQGSESVFSLQQADQMLHLGDISAEVGSVPLADLPPREIADERRQLIEQFHSLGHFGIRHVVRNMRYYHHEWTGIEKDVATVLQGCGVCQRWNIGRKTFQPMRSIFSALPWDHIQMDFHTSMDATSDGYTRILIIVDVFTGLTIAIPLKSGKTTEVMSTLWTLFSLLGIPKIIQSDNDTSFNDKLMTAFKERMGSVDLFSTPYVHRQMGKVENMCKTVSITVRKMLSEKGGVWTDHLDSVMMSINNQIKETHGMSSFQLFFNRPSSLYEGFTPIDMPPHGATKAQLDQWVKHQKLVKEIVFPATADNIKAEQYRQRQRFDKAHLVSVKPIPVNTIVMLWDAVKQSKNEPPYVGPYAIKSRKADGSYILEDMAGGEFHRSVVMDQLKVLTHIGKVRSEAMKGQWYVDFLLKHKFHKATQSYSFLVRWIGFDSTHDEWVAQKDFEDEAVIREYFKGKPVIRRHGKQVGPTSPVSAANADASEDDDLAADPYELNREEGGDPSVDIDLENRAQEEDQPLPRIRSSAVTTSNSTCSSSEAIDQDIDAAAVSDVSTVVVVPTGTLAKRKLQGISRVPQHEVRSLLGSSDVQATPSVIPSRPSLPEGRGKRARIMSMKGIANLELN